MRKVPIFVPLIPHLAAIISHDYDLACALHLKYFRRRMKHSGDIDGVKVIFDDIIVAAQDEIMKELLERAKVKNVKFNPNKLQYKVKEVMYMGNIVSELGLKPDSEKVCAILDMPLPK